MNQTLQLTKNVLDEEAKDTKAIMQIQFFDDILRKIYMVYQPQLLRTNGAAQLQI